jgi:hypothetical protein
MAIGSLDKQGRIQQLGIFARCLVWSGYADPDEITTELYEAALAEERDPQRAIQLATRLRVQAERDLWEQAADWPVPSGFDRLQSALADLRADGILVLEAVDDHWAAAEALETAPVRPRGVAFFTRPDVWHAVEHGMLQIDLWHGSSANVRAGDALLELVIETLARNGIAATFDEGRIETTLSWQRRPT